MADDCLIIGGISKVGCIYQEVELGRRRQVEGVNYTYEGLNV